ncbi:MAG: hypothetical protein M3R36_09865 [Bacteroidota bacterium]|nr:hypothetical protein [Bacteroidota bacterium]
MSDLQIIDNVFNFSSGYINSDVNGDSIVDLADQTMADNNGFNFVSVARP